MKREHDAWMAFPHSRLHSPYYHEFREEMVVSDYAHIYYCCSGHAQIIFIYEIRA